MIIDDGSETFCFSKENAHNAPAPHFCLKGDGGPPRALVSTGMPVEPATEKRASF